MSTMVDALRARFHETHEAWRSALAATPAEALNWRPAPDANSIAMLLSHVVESEHRLLGVALRGDARTPEQLAASRSHAFEAPAGSHEALQALIDGADRDLDGALGRWDTADHSAEFELRGARGSAAWWTLRSLGHGSEHLGHIEITRQWWETRPGR